MNCSRIALAWGVALLLCATAQAATYTCVDGAGRKSFSDRPCPASAADAVRRDIAPSGVLSARHGLTFAVQALADGHVDATCGAAPPPADRPREGGCDRERGDTLCTRALPVLCFKPGQRRPPTPALVDANSGRVVMPPPASQPQLGASPALRGERLASQQVGTRACVEALGTGWRMAGVNDSPSWTLQAQRHASLAEAAGRLWVATNEPRGNCWDEPAVAAPQPEAHRPAVPADEKQLVADLPVDRLVQLGQFAKAGIDVGVHPGDEFELGFAEVRGDDVRLRVRVVEGRIDHTRRDSVRQRRPQGRIPGT